MALPKAARDAISRALKMKDYAKQEPLFTKAFAAVGFPQDPEVNADPAAMTDAQRALCRLFVDAELHPAAFGDYAVPWKVKDRRHWLGLDPPRSLEQLIEFVWEGKKTKQPLWRAMQLVLKGGSRAVTGSSTRLGAILNKLPIADRLELVSELWPPSYDLDLDDILGELRLVEELRKLRDKGKAWAIGRLQFAAEERERTRDTIVARIPAKVVEVALEAILLAKAPIDPAWDEVLPIVDAPYDTAKRFVKVIPTERRDVAIARVLRAGHPNKAMNRSLELAKDFPSRALFEVIFELCEKVERPVRGVITGLRKAAGKNAALLALLEERMRNRPTPKALVVTKYFKPRTARELGATQRKQLEVALRAYDDRQLSADERLGAGDYEETGSVRGMLAITELADGGKPAYTLFEFLGDSGALFAGANKRVASIVQGGLECDDPQVAESVKLALATRSKAKKR